MVVVGSAQGQGQGLEEVHQAVHSEEGVKGAARAAVAVEGAEGAVQVEAGAQEGVVEEGAGEEGPVERARVVGGALAAAAWVVGGRLAHPQALNFRMHLRASDPDRCSLVSAACLAVRQRLLFQQLLLLLLPGTAAWLVSSLPQ